MITFKVIPEEKHYILRVLIDDKPYKQRHVYNGEGTCRILGERLMKSLSEDGEEWLEEYTREYEPCEPYKPRKQYKQHKE